MYKWVNVSLILTIIISRTAATPYSPEPDDFETTALNSADLDYQFFDDQQFDDQNGLAAAFNPDDDETDNLFAQDFSGPDGSYPQAFFDGPESTTNTENSDDRISSGGTCDASIDDESLSSSDLLRARDLIDIFNLRLPDFEKKPFSCKNSGYQSPQPPTNKPEWAPPPTLDPVNIARCPRESDGIQPIALCCYDDDYGYIGQRIAVARKCYTCRFGLVPSENKSLLTTVNS